MNPGASREGAQHEHALPGWKGHALIVSSLGISLAQLIFLERFALADATRADGIARHRVSMPLSFAIHVDIAR